MLFIVAFLVALPVAFGIYALEAWVLTFIWNWAVPLVFSELPIPQELEFWQAFAVLLLFTWLFRNPVSNFVKAVGEAAKE